MHGVMQASPLAARTVRSRSRPNRSPPLREKARRRLEAHPSFHPLPSQALSGPKVTARTARAAGARSGFRVRADAKELTFDMKSRIKIQQGIDMLADAVAVTLGPRGASRDVSLRNRARDDPRVAASLPAPVPPARSWTAPPPRTLQPTGRNVVLSEKTGMPQVRARPPPTSPTPTASIYRV